MAILAAGVGFAIRGAILGTWAATFKFSGVEVGLINGAGFTGFCFGIVIGGVVADKIGYGKLVVAALALHVISALVTFAVADTMDPKTAFALLWTACFLFAVANGTLEAVANPLVATLFPENRAHYLNILHASWPLGMVIGGFAVQIFGGSLGWGWKGQLCLFLVPTAIYALMFFGQHFPQSAASKKGLSLGEMLRDVGVIGALVIAFFIGLFVKDGLGPLLQGFTGSTFFETTTWMYVSVAVGFAVWLIFSGLSGWALGSFLLFTLFVVHALVGAVELGTDGWIQNITGAILTPSQGTYLFIFTSLVMFGLRFCAGFIEKNLKLSPVGLLLACASVACFGLNLVAALTTFGGAMGALAVYALGKTFFWPTMLAVASDRFPRTGAVAISIMGGIGMMSAGLVGSPGLGYAKDRFAAESVPAAEQSAQVGTKESKWLFFSSVKTLDVTKLEAAKGALKTEVDALEKAGSSEAANAITKLPAPQQAILNADIAGARKTLKADSFIPATMAAIFLLLLLFFKSIGGYRPLTIEEEG